MEVREYRFRCPYCGQTISVLVDPLIEEQQYVEDCEICCNPIEISCRIQDGEVVEFSANQS
jgi:transcription elongation factor Elf1